MVAVCRSERWKREKLDDLLGKETDVTCSLFTSMQTPVV